MPGEIKQKDVSLRLSRYSREDVRDTFLKFRSDSKGHRGGATHTERFKPKDIAFHVLFPFLLLRGTFNDLPIGFTIHQQNWRLSGVGESDLLQTWPGVSQLLHAEFQIRGHLEAPREVGLWVDKI